MPMITSWIYLSIDFGWYVLAVTKHPQIFAWGVVHPAEKTQFQPRSLQLERQRESPGV